MTFIGLHVIKRITLTRNPIHRIRGSLCYLPHQDNMPVNKTAGDKQSKISNFFHKPATKTKINSNDENENPAKLAKLENENSSTLKSPDSKNTDSRLEMTSPKRDEKSPMVESPLSPEQRERMEKSKQAAMEKLKEKQEQAQGIGASWKEALTGEFQKPYYKKVSL